MGSKTAPRAILIVLDSFGVGAAPDVEQYDDAPNVNTAKHVVLYDDTLLFPNLELLGLNNIVPGLETHRNVSRVVGAFGKLTPQAAGKDTVTGHWELAGVVKQEPFATFPEGFPQKLLEDITRVTGKTVVDGGVVSGTVVIEQLGPEHLETGKIIVYTSKDSVIQVAAHDSVLPVPQLHEMCSKISSIAGEYNVGRVIARPFVGEPGSFIRTYDRKDYVVPPVEKTLLDRVSEAGQPVVAIGKIGDIYGNRGVTTEVHTAGNNSGMSETIKWIEEGPDGGLIMTNLVDFDMLYGHRRDVAGYSKSLKEFDEWLPTLFHTLRSNDIVILSADHGNDPTAAGFNHTREFAPMLSFGDSIRPNVRLGTRSSFADVGQTIADFLNIERLHSGVSFKNDIMI